MTFSENIAASAQTDRRSKVAPHFDSRRDQFGRDNKSCRFLSLAQVLNRVSVSRSTLYANIKDPTLPFPSPVHIGRRSVWVEHEVEAYMQAVIETSRSVDPHTNTPADLR